jgi:phospholipid/cholesterol/gamma-HCH transport system ATP-binding protein
MVKNTPVIQINGLKNNLGGQWVHSDVNLTVNKGEIFAIIGGSGSGKTTILRSILMLLKPTEGSINIVLCFLR